MINGQEVKKDVEDHKGITILGNGFKEFLLPMRSTQDWEERMRAGNSCNLIIDIVAFGDLARLGARVAPVLCSGVLVATLLPKERICLTPESYKTAESGAERRVLSLNCNPARHSGMKCRKQFPALCLVPCRGQPASWRRLITVSRSGNCQWNIISEGAHLVRPPKTHLLAKYQGYFTSFTCRVITSFPH